MEQLSDRFIGALATDMLVGREAERTAIQEAVRRVTGEPFQLLIFVAKGGIGKTRLLREAANLVVDTESRDIDTDQAEAGSATPVLCLPLIDLADPILHREVSFLRNARNRFGEVLPTQAADLFAAFDIAFKAFLEARERGAPYREVQAASQAVVGAFDADYRALTERYRVVWLLDTLEQVYGVPPNIEALLRKVNIEEIDIGQTTYSWLMNFVEQQPRNTTLLMAGRPEPGRWVRDIRIKAGNRAVFHQFDLQPFSLQETNDYFKHLSGQLAQNGFVATAEFLKEMQEDPERPQVMFLLTGGNPIRLALYIDMMAHSRYEPPEFEMSLDELQALGEPELDALRDRVNRQLLAYIESGLGHPQSDVLNYLFVTRRGLNVDRLEHIWGAPRAQCEAILNHLQRLSFVKWRGSKAYLHDELYTMYARRLIAARSEASQEYAILQRNIELTYTKMIAFLEKRVDEATRQIAEIQGRYEDGAIFSETDRLELRKLRQRRPRYKAEELHYYLYLDPVAAFNDQYYTFAEQAFLGNDFDLDNYLQSEIDTFFFGATREVHREQVQLSPESWSQLRRSVAEERTARWVKRLAQYSLLGRAQRFADELQAAYPEIIVDDESGTHGDQAELSVLDADSNGLFQHEVEAYRCFAAILQGEAIGPTVARLEAVIVQIENKLRQRLIPKAERKRVRNVVGQCLLYNGYGYAQIGNYRLAQERYEKANTILDITQHVVLRAEVKNDLSRVLGELGQRIEAEGYCIGALETRKQLGFDYATALSLNTLALIYNHNSRPTPARLYAKEALRLFRQLDSPRGIVLALKQRAEGTRRSWGLNPKDQPITMLDEAEALLQEAKQIFADGKLQEQVLHIQILIERGSLHRDWATHLGRPHGDEHFAQARMDFDTARQMARSSEDTAHELDALVNKAYLYVKYGDHDEGQHIIDEAIALVPDHYKLEPGRVLHIADDMRLTIFNQLSKLLALQARNVPLNRETFQDVLRYRILGTTYSQLFSKTSWYCGEHRKELHRLLDTSSFYTPTVEEQMAREIIQLYKLPKLAEQNPVIGPLQAEQVIQELAARQTVDYLDDD